MSDERRGMEAVLESFEAGTPLAEVARRSGKAAWSSRAVGDAWVKSCLSPSSAKSLWAEVGAAARHHLEALALLEGGEEPK